MHGGTSLAASARDKPGFVPIAARSGAAAGCRSTSHAHRRLGAAVLSRRMRRRAMRTHGAADDAQGRIAPSYTP